MAASAATTKMITSRAAGESHARRFLIRCDVDRGVFTDVAKGSSCMLTRHLAPPLVAMMNVPVNQDEGVVSLQCRESSLRLP